MQTKTTRSNTKPRDLWGKPIMGQRQYAKRGVPRSIPAGQVLAHNHVWHTLHMAHGVNGFRCWTWPRGKVPRNFKRCKCGWSGLPHYRLRGETKREDAQGDRCIKRVRK